MSWEDSPSISFASELMDSHMQYAERDQLLQKYTYLTIEAERLKSNVSQSLSVYSTSTYQGQLGLNPTSSRKSKSPSPSVSSPPSRRPSTSDRVSAHPGPQQSHNAAIDEADGHALMCIQQQIKATLTGLLNCKDVKGDQTLRSWVQQRLMEAEQEMRTRKRRRRSGCEAGGAFGSMMGKRSIA